jgi:hypothetical protein
MESLSHEGSLVPKSKRPNVEEIIRRKDRSVDCEHCLSMPAMRYKKLVGRMAQWSPAPYAWVCPQCSGIRHDGSIDPNERTWDYIVKVEDKRRISDYLSAILKAQKEKSGSEN